MAMYISAEKKYTERPDTSMFQIHTHENYEVFYFLTGDARYYIEGNIYELSPGDLLLINKAEAHSLLINKCTPYTRITVNFCLESLFGDTDGILKILSAKPLGYFNRIHGTAEENHTWLHYLENIVSSDENKQRMYLTVLLNELSKKLEARQEHPQEHTADRIIEYINQNLNKIENLDELCNRFYISKTHLNRRFKSITGSTVWDYITAKRLLKAKEMLQSGISPTEVSEMVGYSEYSTFYRAYRLRFGTSPKNDYKK